MGNFRSRKPNRLDDYDYSKNGYYYVTICLQNSEHIFGEIINNEMVLNKYGEIAKYSWLDIPNHHGETKLDKFIIMPNHMHRIIFIHDPVGNGPARSFNKKNNLSIIIGSYKSTVTKQINRITKNGFKWQKSFYDQIIRQTQSLNKIREYIVNNPATWDTDENNI